MRQQHSLSDCAADYRKRRKGKSRVPRDPLETISREDGTMPLPKPRKNEKEDDFISRCMGDDITNEDYPDQKQRAAVCNRLWDDKDKKSGPQPDEMRGAIGSHSTDTTEEAWDAGANVGRLKDDAGAAYYRKMYAWADPEGDPQTKAAYKFPHHMVDGDGAVGAANTNGCSAGIAVLNGGRGGANIPEADRSGIHAHLAKHIKDAGKEAPELNMARSLTSAYERRMFPTTELRLLEGAGGLPMLQGHASVFDRETIIDWGWFGGFMEVVRPGAFTKTLKEADVRALFNHNPDYVLGRTKNGTVRLREDEVGLFMENDPPNTTWAADLTESIRRKDISQMSFGFRVIKERVTKGPEDAFDLREILEVELFDVSPVTFPAYPETDVAVREYRSMQSTMASIFKDIPRAGKTLFRASRGIELDPADRETVSQMIDNLKRHLPASEPATGHSEAPAEPVNDHSGERTAEPATGHSEERIVAIERTLDLLRRELELQALG